MENLIGYGSIGREKVCDICQKLDIYQEIISMPQGFDTILKEDGSPLSGGQRQRLCLARAFLRAGDVLLLDEPTAEIDQIHKRLLGELLCVQAKEKIVVVITHDPFWKDFENTVSVMERRKPVERNS